MALKPVLKLKVDELFLRWLSDQDTQHLLKTNLRQILKGEPLTTPGPAAGLHGNQLGGGVRGTRPQSPRVRPGSPSTPPCSPSLVSPRSPRRSQNNRSLFARQLNKVIKEKDAVNREKEAPTNHRRGEPTNHRRGEPDGEANTFLRQKEAQLREKREREQRQKDDKDSKKGVSGGPSVTPGGPAGDPSAPLDAKGIKKKDGLLAAALSSLKNQNSSQPITSSPRVKVVPASDITTPDTPSPTDTPKNTDTPTPTTQPGDAKPSLPAKPSQPSAARQPPSGPPNGHPTPPVHIPAFYFPLGRPPPSDGLEVTAQRIKDEFDKADGGKIQRQDAGRLAKACGFPFYWKCPLFNHAGGEKSGHVTLQSFLAAWRKLVTSCHDNATRFMRIMSTVNRPFLEEDEFLPLIQDVVDTHPGLSFLQDAPEFHSRYVQTVISRIFYTVNRSWSGRINAAEVRKSNLIQTLALLEDEEDINQVTDFFSYEHFYVIYCKFWELDKDHDLYISPEDLSRHNDHVCYYRKREQVNMGKRKASVNARAAALMKVQEDAGPIAKEHNCQTTMALSLRMIDRIFSGAVTRNLTDNKMVYKDFVWFLISEEDKRHPTSVEYWFRCMDLDGDGVISMYEMEYFYEEQIQKMEALGIETLPFEDCLCQMLDMIRPARPGCVSLQDLKACKLTPIFLDTFFNLEKYLEHEQKDPFSNLRDHDGEEAEMTDWERYAAEEYELLVAEEGATEEINYEDDFEPEDELLSPKSPPGEGGDGVRLSDPPHKRKPGAGAGGPPGADENIYDYTDRADNVTY